MNTHIFLLPLYVLTVGCVITASLGYAIDLTFAATGWTGPILYQISRRVLPSPGPPRPFDPVLCPTYLIWILYGLFVATGILRMELAMRLGQPIGLVVPILFVPAGAVTCVLHSYARYYHLRR